MKTMAPEGPASLSGKINIGKFHWASVSIFIEYIKFTGMINIVYPFCIPGDRILEINGQSLEGLSRQEVIQVVEYVPRGTTNTNDYGIINKSDDDDGDDDSYYYYC